MKNAIMQVTYFLNGPMINLSFFLSYYFILRESDFFKGDYRNTQTFAFPVLWEFSFWASRYGAV